MGVAQFPSQGLKKSDTSTACCSLHSPCLGVICPCQACQDTQTRWDAGLISIPCWCQQLTEVNKNSPGSFRGSQLSARLPLFFRTQSWHLCQGHILSGSTGWISSPLWEAAQRGTWPKGWKGSQSLSRGPGKGKGIQGPGVNWTSGQYLRPIGISQSF